MLANTYVYFSSPDYSEDTENLQKKGKESFELSVSGRTKSKEIKRTFNLFEVSKSTTGNN